MVRGKSRARRADERTALMEADADCIVRAVSDRDGPAFSQSADGKFIAAGSDANWKCAVVLGSYLAGDAAGKPVPRFLAESAGTRLEAGGARARHGRSRAWVVRPGVSGDLTLLELFLF